ncbi:MAG: DUF222 domain-containing protein, partial [Actinomycetales bacterium]|nr:DUF222 domain-containing protein [Actinomycetales bacterium]
MRSDPDPSLEPVPDDPRADLTELPLYATAEEVAYAAELAALDRADHAALRAEWAAAGYDLPDLDAAGFDVPVDDAAWDEALAELADDDALVGALQGPAHAADLMLVESIDPRSLTSKHAQVDYLQACDRIAAKVSAHRSDAVVALAGERSSAAYLTEIHAEHELALAERTSKYAAGKLIERSRALATTFPGFAAALRAGEVSELHCTVLVERTRVVADPAVLAEIERRVLPKARRMTAGQLAGEVAKAIALLDRDAAARVRKAREGRRVWARQTEDGMGILGMVHDWPTIESMMRQIRADGRALQLARRAAEADPAGTATETVDADDRAAESVEEDATADACRADAFAARVCGKRGEDGSLTWDRSQVEVRVNVVIDLDTLRGEADRMALLDGQPVPAEIAREVAGFAA